VPRKSICARCKQVAPSEEPVVRLNVEIDGALYQRLKITAIQEGLTLSKVIRQMAEEFVASHRSRTTTPKEARV